MNIDTDIVTSRNYDQGRAGHKIEGIVLHTMVGTMAGSQARFNDPSSQVSVHYGVGLNGSIRRWVMESDTAWQAGNYQVNLTTIGIEHEDNGNANDSRRTDALYESSSSLAADICKRYGFPADKDHIFLHKNIIDKSKYRGGTACPDGLDTDRIISMAANKLQGESPMTKAEAASMLDEFFWKFTNRKVKQSELDEYVPQLVAGNFSAFFTKAAKFGEVKDWISSANASAAPVDKGAVLDYLNKNLK